MNPPDCIPRRLATSRAGTIVGMTEVHDDGWLVSLIDYDLNSSSLDSCWCWSDSCGYK